MQMSLGEHLKVTLLGSSHGPFVGATIEGLPAGITLDEACVRTMMEQRRPGGRYSSQRREADEVQWLSGLNNGITDGSILECRIMNNDVKSKDYEFLPDHPRPGHQDMVMMKRTDGAADLRGGGTSSARMTAPLVAIYGLLSPYLLKMGVRFEAQVGAIGSVEAKPLEQCPPRWASEACEQMRCQDPEAATKMIGLIERYRRERNSIGSRVDLVISGLPLGVGEPWFDGLEPALARALMAVPAARGVEFGHGFSVQTMTGSEHNSAWGGDANHPVLQGERPDGALAGLATGSPIHARLALKPPSSIPQEQITLNLRTNQQEALLVKGRHDPVLAPRAVPVMEAMACIVVADLMLRGGFWNE
ncbi:MAG: chorismate synthase [Candidatus Poseidonia sp.]|nr:chorismate synthase [Poseidonia sp.]